MRTTTACCPSLDGTAGAGAPRVEDVMVRRPRTLPVHACVGDVRSELADDHQHMVLLVDVDDVLVGTVLRGDLPADARPASPARPWSTLDGRTTGPATPTTLVRAGMAERGSRRLAVVDAQGRLLGLVCLKRSGDGFCSDADVAARARGDRG